ncbi:transcriptional regulator Spx [Lactococcus lactis]|uniref:Spx/MgsR family RNA polymerase-binding regulatory protein n=1 Tax=Lactococcus lactis TaxID=1358 RepID=UPI001914CD73|nr:Spx/MgsR family RNA polymerase-binding regulatory protein [Lactococcus lactis]MBK5076276.1 transcriptional regulator Spx [Lactococcus lactis]WDA68879.1 Spx/MgsR family RNA polymerase-binding regulatory protein [Lactococcus lactis]
MITIYTKGSCLSSRNVRKWLENHHILFKEVNLTTQTISKEEFMELLRFTQFGTQELLSRNSNIYRKLSKRYNFQELTLSELILVVQAYPSLLRKPIVFDGKRLQVGYNEDEMRKFIPRLYRKVNLMS